MITCEILKIQKLRDGGFLVVEDRGRDGFHPAIFACTYIDEALAFIRKNLSAPSAAGLVE